MRKMLGGLFVMGLLLLAAIPTWAQDATPMPGLTPTFVPTPGTYGEPPYPNFYEAIRQANVCPEDLLEANRSLFRAEDLELIEMYHLNNSLAQSLPMGTVIPPHEDCYDKMITTLAQLPQIEREHNICMEEYYPLIIWTQTATNDKIEVYLRKDALPCINEAGQRLTYFDEDGNYLKTPVYSSMSLIETPASTDLADTGYCIGDLARANPAIFSARVFNLYRAEQGMRLFLPANARHCDHITPPEIQTLYQVSQDLNICMETLLDASGYPLYNGALMRLSVPVAAAPCYNEDGQRIGAHDREIYSPQAGESFLDIARAKSVCLDDLWDANPVMEYWKGWAPAVPAAVFIPDLPPCDGSTTYTVRTHQTLYGLSLLTNVCFNRLEDANPSLSGWVLDTVPEGKVLTIPQRPHCYDFSEGGTFMQPYVCYEVPVPSDADFTGHTPAVTASSDTDLPYCYERTDGMTVFYENQPYSLYKMHGYETLIVLQQCFGVDADAMREIQTYDAPWFGRPVYGGSMAYILIPQPHADCPLLGVNDDTHRQIYTQMTYQAGLLQDGVYVVNYNDTLSSIGRTYGYLPQSIADTNSLSDPDSIYFLQELKLPPYPSLYTLVPVGGAGGAIVLASTVIYGLRRWSRSRSKSKKKNSEK